MFATTNPTIWQGSWRTALKDGYEKLRMIARMGTEIYRSSGPQKMGIFQLEPVATMRFRSWDSWQPCGRNVLVEVM